MEVEPHAEYEFRVRFEHQAHPGKEMITTCQTRCAPPRFPCVLLWVLQTRSSVPATRNHWPRVHSGWASANCRKIVHHEASLRLAEESAPSRACQWHPQAWQVGRRSSVRILGLRLDTQYKLLLSPVYTSTVEVPSSFSCRCAGAVWRSTPSVSKSLQQGAGSGRSAASRAGWRRAAALARRDASSRTVRDAYVGTPGAQPRSWSEGRIDFPTNAIARQQGAEFAQTALARAIGHRWIDGLKKVLSNMKDIEFSDTTYVKRAMKLLGQL